MKDAARNLNTDAVAAYLTGKRQFPEELSRHLARRGYRWLSDRLATEQVLSVNFGFSSLSRHPESALLIPYYGLDGKPATWGASQAQYSRIRCEPALEMPGDDGKVDHIRYLQPPGARNFLYCPEGVLEKALEQKQLIITEGELKAELATWMGFPTVALAGVDSWRYRQREKKLQSDGSRKTEKGGRVILPEFDQIPWAEFKTYIIYDSDASDNEQVSIARSTLAKHLREDRLADVWIVDLPPDSEEVPDAC